MPSFPNGISPENAEVLRKFRKCVADILEPKHDDYYLLRWLRARNFKLKEAEDMIRKSMAWRKVVRADDVLQFHKRLEVVVKYWPLGILGKDRLGCPVAFWRYGDSDIKGITYSLRRSDFIEEFIYFMEMCEDLMRKNPEREKHENGILAIADVNNFCLQSNTCAPVFSRIKDIICLLEANYPESLRSIYMVNAPAIFQVLLALARPFMHEKTYKKVHVYGRSDWKEDLLKEVDESVLPAAYGGKRVGPNNDIYAYDLVPKGGSVPKSFYVPCRLTNEDQSKCAEVEARSSYTVEVSVEKPQAVLNWEYKTKDHNIGFGLFYARNGVLEELIPTERQNCHNIPENGSWLCTKAGIYVLKFDNGFSWIRSKSLTYWTEVLAPGN